MKHDPQNNQENNNDDFEPEYFHDSGTSYSEKEDEIYTRNKRIRAINRRSSFPIFRDHLRDPLGSYDEDDEDDEDDEENIALQFEEHQNQITESYEERAHYGDANARSDEEGWFYDDDDDDGIYFKKKPFLPSPNSDHSTLATPPNTLAN